MYVYGCGKVFEKKQDYLLDNFCVSSAIDNYKSGNLHLNNGEEISIISLDDVDNNSPIIIMREEYINAWRELRSAGILNEVIFPYQILPRTEIENRLFSEGERLYEKEGTLFYVDKTGKEFCVSGFECMSEFLQYYERQCISSNEILALDTKPLNRNFGFSRGTPIDRYYIENWLEKNKFYIAGDVLEIAENTYTKKYGGERVKNSYMLHVENDMPPFIKGNFETGEGIEREKVDCIILTQTLPFIFDVESALKNIYKMLRPKGTLMITVSALEQISRFDMERWGDYWRFTDLSLRKLIKQSGFDEIQKIDIYGNVKVACGILYGVAAEEFSKTDLDYYDEDYPVIICAVCKKK
ncbi:MAG: methyltransferase domain-containing protein [Lachnospiraceae bacterium]|nr:methyltransferase domain-containing protein [Lachnospiraceae bacterium]